MIAAKTSQTHIDIAHLSSHQLDRLAARAARLSRIKKQQEPPMSLAIHAGIKLVNVSISGFSKPGYTGEVSFLHQGRQWKAIGHSPRIEDNSLYGDGFIEFVCITGQRRRA